MTIVASVVALLVVRAAVAVAVVVVVAREIRQRACHEDGVSQYSVHHRIPTSDPVDYARAEQAADRERRVYRRYDGRCQFRAVGRHGVELQGGIRREDPEEDESQETRLGYGRGDDDARRARDGTENDDIGGTLTSMTTTSGGGDDDIDE